jgi:hypothetical protein
MKLNKLFLFFVLLCLVASPVAAYETNDPDASHQWYLEHVGITEAWETTTGSDDVVVAVLDTGVDLDHEDLENNIWVNEGEIADDGIDNDGNGYIDDVYGWDFIDDDNTPEPNKDMGYDEDSVPHGTIIAGIIAAEGDNAKGITGVSMHAKIMSLRIMNNQGVGDSVNARKAIEYAIANGADVVNMSLAGYTYDSSFARVLEEAFDAGVVIVAAVGNVSGGGWDLEEHPSYPACYEDENDDWVIGVAATQREDKKARFSNYGGDCVDISAPGVDIYSTYYYDLDWHPFDDEMYWGYWTGTSMSAPIVAGAVALLKGYYPSLTPSQVATILKLSVSPVQEIGSITRADMGAGIINVAQAFAIAGSFADPVDESDEVVEDDVAEAEIAVVTGVSPSTHIIVVPEGGSPPVVRVFDKSGVVLTEFNAYHKDFAGGVRVAVGDVDGDLEDEIVTVPGYGGGPHVRIFEMDGTEVDQFMAFNSYKQSGFYVATGDLDGDEVEEIIISTDANGNDFVRAFESNGTAIGDFELHGVEGFSTRVATADIHGDGVDELVISFGAGIAPYVYVMGLDGTVYAQFYAYEPTYGAGVFVAAGDINNDGLDEIVTGTDEGGGPHIRIFTGYGTLLGTFFGYDELFRGGVRVSVGNLSDAIGGTASIIAAAGPGGGPHIRVFNDHAELIGTFFTDDEADRQGINVGTWSY